MRKTHKLSGPPAPEKSLATTVCAEIETIQPPHPKGTRKVGSGKPSFTGGPDPISDLAERFMAYQVSGSREDRERFYQSLWRIAEIRACRQLAAMSWQGDVRQDAMDITSVFCTGLVGQEERGSGLFAPTDRTSIHLRRYLYRTIHDGVEELAWKMRSKRRQWLNFEEDAVLAAADTRKSDWLPQVLRLAKALDAVRTRNPKLIPVAAGSTSLDFVLSLNLKSKIRGGEVKNLVRHEGVFDRTRQHWAKDLRNDLSNDFSNELEF